MEQLFFKTAREFLDSGSTLQPFHPFPTGTEREFYDNLPRELRDRLIKHGEAYLGFSYPTLRATDFMAYHRTGNRVDYEDIFFARRYALNTLVVAECLEDQGRFLDDIINGIFALCEESAWQLPAHNSYLRGAPSELLPDVTRPVLDLFSCETGALLACIYYLLKDKLDGVSSFITKRIRLELEQRILTPYLEEHFWWMGDGNEPMCNWTPWCTQNVLLTAFLTGCSEETGRRILQKAAASCDAFLKDYGEDGCCDEGAHYYRHAGLCLDGAFGVLDQITGGAFAELMERDKIKNIAAYIYHVHVDDKYYFNFADCSPIVGRAGVREYLFGKHTGQPELMAFAAEDLRASEAELFADESHQLNLFYRLQTLFFYQEVMDFAFSKPALHQDIYYPSVGLFLSRNSAFALAVKAGDNDDSHNHNDVGSFILYKTGQPIFVDIGVESYTQKTFSNRRYEIWTMQSGYHNLPTIEGLDQHEGAAFCADKVETSMDTALSSISMELSGAYPFSAAKPSYRRQVAFDKKRKPHHPHGYYRKQ